VVAVGESAGLAEGGDRRARRVEVGDPVRLQAAEELGDGSALLERITTRAGVDVVYQDDRRIGQCSDRRHVGADLGGVGAADLHLADPASALRPGHRGASQDIARR